MIIIIIIAVVVVVVVVVITGLSFVISFTQLAILIDRLDHTRLHLIGVKASRTLIIYHQSFDACRNNNILTSTKQSVSRAMIYGRTNDRPTTTSTTTTMLMMTMMKRRRNMTSLDQRHDRQRTTKNSEHVNEIITNQIVHCSSTSISR